MNRNFALVTGASSGIGKAIALELAGRQINLVLVALPQTGLRETAHEIGDTYHVEIKYYETDLTHECAVRDLYNWCRQQDLKIKTLINNAGIGTHSAFEQATELELETMLKLNNQALVMMTYYFLPDLKRCTPAHILNVGSLASFMNIPGKAVYSASKSFVYSFSLSLRMELRPYKVSVSCLCPGGTITSNRVLHNINKVRLAGRMMLQMPEEVAREAVTQMLNRRKLIIPGWQNKFLYRLWSLLPQRLVDRILAAMFFRKEPVRKPIASATVAFRALAV